MAYEADPNVPADRKDPNAGVSTDSIHRGFEELQTSTRGLFYFAIIAPVTLTVMLGLLVWLMFHYLHELRPEDVRASAAPVLPVLPVAPLEPMPQHNDLDWMDLVHLRQDENAQFVRLGWSINQTTGEPIMPASLRRVMRQQYAGNGPAVASAAGLRFPPVIPPVRVGAMEAAALANVMPPVGSAATAEEQPPSIYRPPEHLRDVKQLPEQTGLPGLQNNPNAAASISSTRPAAPQEQMSP